MYIVTQINDFIYLVKVYEILFYSNLVIEFGTTQNFIFVSNHLENQLYSVGKIWDPFQTLITSHKINIFKKIMDH